MKFSIFALGAIGASLAMLSSAPAIAAAHTGKPIDSAAAMTDKAMARSGKTRAEVKRERDAAPHIPAGENVSGVPGQAQNRGRMSDTTRAEVKREAAAAEKAGTALPAGENITQIPGQRQVKGAHSNKTRAEVKAKAKQARNDGAAVQPGEATTKAQEKGMAQRPK